MCTFRASDHLTPVHGYLPDPCSSEALAATGDPSAVFLGLPTRQLEGEGKTSSGSKGYHVASLLPMEPF